MTRVCVALLVALGAAAVDPPPPSVRLDVVVTNTRGAAIADLRPGDFELKEDGVVRPIDGVELRASGPRVFAFVLDEFHIAPGAPSERVRQSLSSYIDTHLRPGDLAVAVKPLDTVASLQFTTDRASLLAAVGSFEGRKGDLSPRSSFERQFIGHAPATVEAARTQIVSAALRELSLRFGELGADRGVIVLVSEGFARVPAVRQTRVPDLQGVIRAASRFHLAMYSFSPADRDPAAAISGDQSTLDWLAKETGGRASLDGRTFDEALGRMAADLESYYAITYAPAHSDGRFHAIELTTKRKNVEVRARPGYWASLSSEVRALIDPPAASVSRRALKRSTVANIWTGLSIGADGHVQVTVTWEPRGPQRATSLTLKAASSDGRALFEGTISPVGSEPSPSTSATFDVPPGNLELDANVLSITGATIDTDVRDVQIPDLEAQGKGPAILTPQVVRARTMPEFRILSAEPLAAPTPSRDFSRGDRLLINVPVWSSAGTTVKVTATVTNSVGGTMRVVDRDDRSSDTLARFELPLAWLAPGAYQVVFKAKAGSGEATQAVRFSVR